MTARSQVLGAAWDARPTDIGGQRWYSIYPDERIDPDDPLHWTGRDQRWNFMCAECHSTDITKAYDPDTDTYATTWEEIDVACESCHGPASRHLEWARIDSGDGDRGLIELGDAGAAWVMNPDTGIAERSRPRTHRTQSETCARCHSRRSIFSEDYRHGRPLLDTHRLSLLDEPLYFADGQIREEVYVHGSFLQSRMYGAGVTCSDCHDPHSMQVRGEANARCAACHLPERFDTPEHHFHAADSEGPECVSCHMPERLYMGVDGRRDHSFRIPRPDLSDVLDTPDACTGCHQDRPPAWAAARVAEWYGPDRRQERHYGEVLRAARNSSVGAQPDLLELALDVGQAGIVRATALSLVAAAPTAAFRDAVEVAVRDRDPLVRQAAMTPLEAVDPAARPALMGPLLDDPVRGVRIEAARLLAPLSPEQLPPGAPRKVVAALLEYRTGLRLNSDRPESWLNLGILEASLGDLPAAERAYRSALELDDGFVPAMVNLADLRRAQGRDAEGEELLRKAIEIAESAESRHALGLVLVRLDRLEEALAELGTAAGDAPDHPRYAYVYAVALESAGRADAALAELGRHQRLHPTNADTLVALATLSRKHGRPAEALAWARRLLELDPAAPGPRQLLRELQELVRELEAGSPD